MTKALLAELKAAIDGEHVEVFDVDLETASITACWYLAEGPELFGVLFDDDGSVSMVDYMDSRWVSAGHAYDVADVAGPYIANALAWRRRCEEMAEELDPSTAKKAGPS